VNIQWKPVLEKFVIKYGGSKPVYTREETEEDTFQQRVSFSFPLDSSGVRWDAVSLPGDICSSSCEAQSKAAATALQRFTCGIHNTKLMDISQACYEELKANCKEILLKAGELHLAVNMILSDWLQCTKQIYRTYEDLSATITYHLYGESNSRVKRLRNKVSKQLLVLSTTNYARYDTLVNRSGIGKSYLKDANTSMQKLFTEYLIPRVLPSVTNALFNLLQGDIIIAKRFFFYYTNCVSL
jgi:hypothetical protein